MKCKNNPSIKNYCSKSPDCDIVETGAVQSVWSVCRTCKEEVSESLKDRVASGSSSPVEQDSFDYGGWANGPQRY